jgi:hypothetical protein
MAADELERLIFADDRRTEQECGAHLDQVVPYLLGGTPVEVIRLSREERCFYGASDFIVSGRMRGDAGVVETVVRIWELKAPQCYIMERDDSANRFRPTLDLIKAENQLLHYYYEAEQSTAFMERYKISSRRNIQLGGIIIGRDDRLARDPQDADQANPSLAIRKRYFYGSKIRLITWNRVLDQMRELKGPQQAS